jgi:imidazolonepropionase-like amidohydrolase
MRFLTLALGIWIALSAQTPQPFDTLRAAPRAVEGPRTLGLFLLEHRVGEERYSTEARGDTNVLTSHFEYIDRGTKIALDTTLTYASRDFTPLSFESHGKSYRYFSVDTSVPNPARTANTFTLDGMAPLSAQAVLIQYWIAHGKPPQMHLAPSGDTVRIREIPEAPDMHYLHNHPARRFIVDGVIWGQELLLLDANDFDVIAAATTAGVLDFEAATADVTAERSATLAKTIRGLALDAATAMPRVEPFRSAHYALTGGRLIDGTGAAPIEHAVVIVNNNKIEAAGSAEAVHVPKGVPTIDVTGKSILPGLWDMHAHVGQAVWGPVYLAAGVTTARDMGGEFEAVTTIRDSWRDGRLVGPRLLLAGLVDGPGPNAFGAVTAATTEEAQAVVRRYKNAGFQQMKIYSLLDKPTTKAVIDAAHASDMTVTGHIPNGLSLRDVVEMGFDNVAHLVVRGAPGSDELKDTIALLKAHGTVMDPTISWNELLGRSAETPIASFQPGIEHVAPPLRRLLESANGGNVTPQQAQERLTRSLEIIKALHDAGLPIVAGTDKGVPGVSVAREIELYVQAGFTPIDAIRAASAIPARVMGLDRDSGTIAAGLRADLIVVDGNPLANISDIRKVTHVCANGRLFETAPLWSAGGFRP